jgi:flagellar secretion chaperone FliS
MLDPTAAYRTGQVTSAGPATRIVLLYEGAIRFGMQHVAALADDRLEAAHAASIRCQEIVGALRASLDPAAGPIATDLDRLYDFVQDRLVRGNIAKSPGPTDEALAILRELLAAWRQVAGGAGAPLANGAGAPQVAASDHRYLPGSAPAHPATSAL